MQTPWHFWSNSWQSPGIRGVCGRSILRWKVLQGMVMNTYWYRHFTNNDLRAFTDAKGDLHEETLQNSIVLYKFWGIPGSRPNEIPRVGRQTMPNVGDLGGLGCFCNLGTPQNLGIWRLIVLIQTMGDAKNGACLWPLGSCQMKYQLGTFVDETTTKCPKTSKTWYLITQFIAPSTFEGFLGYLIASSLARKLTGQRLISTHRG